MTKSILSQLSIIMTSSFDIVSPPRIRGGIRQVSWGTTAGLRRIRGGIRVSRGGIESGQVRGSAGGLEKLSAGVRGLVKKPLDCTVPRLGKRELICLLSFTCNYVVFVWRGFLFLWVLGMGYVILLWHSLSLPYNYFALKI